ncbi:acidic leucine-rich nuclear phosphoprotein 32 family member A [Condylostylus longicornis]|uniref:acidic leucine-rich nuclear phosphoprotein 32 family member A n=1 Tax=Condylostylus longicornis TaxID=2530218 RepID=UPI00244E2451|nr:acidic leucine-rich nuclear phosphoprotein 32 family member A [Condylostylus longicornis]
MEKRIELEKRGRPASQITDLNLDNCRSTNIVGLTDEFEALESLSLINVGLTTLRGFPNLPNLRKLELSDNRISNGLENLVTSPKLTYLNLSGNKIKDLEALKPLENFKSLKVLDLFNNPATAIENYREKTFAMLRSLKYLDGFDFNEIEASSDGYDDFSDTEEEVDTDEESDEEIDNDEESHEESDNDDVSLAQVYNDNLEDDNSDWKVESEENEEDSDEDDLSDENGPGDKSTEGEKNTSAKEKKKSAENNEKDGPSEESRGKKRKHDE